MALEIFAADLELAAHELIAELEGLQTVAADGAVAQADDHAAQDSFQLLLDGLELVHGAGVLDLFADHENGGRKPAGLGRADPRDLGVECREDRTDDAERASG